MKTDLDSIDLSEIDTQRQEIDGLVDNTYILIQNIKQRGESVITDLESTNRKFLGKGRCSVAFLLTLPSGKQVVHKVSDDPHQVQNEILGTQLAETAGVGAPHIFRSDDRSVTETYVDGDDTNTTTVITSSYRSVFEDLGRQLAKLHHTKGSGFGTHENGSGAYKNQEDYLERGKIGFALLDDNLVSVQEKGRILKNLQQPVGYEDPDMLLHGDVHLGNMKVNIQQGSMNGFVDFGGIKSGPVELEFISLYKIQQMFPRDLPIYDIARGTYEQASGRSLNHKLVQQLLLARSHRYFRNPNRVTSTRKIIHSIIN